MIKEIFSDIFLVNSKFLNLLGIQSFRYSLASLIYVLRGLVFRWSKTKLSSQLQKEGIVIIDEFLNQNDSKQFLEDFNKLFIENKKEIIIDGDTTTERISIHIDEIENFKILKNIVFNEELIDLLETAERRKFKERKFHNPGMYGQVVWVDKIRNNGNEIKDSQKTLHSDTFFNTHKVWYFPTEVTEKMGPLCFVKKSHRFNFHKLALEYLNSISKESDTNVRANKQKLTKYENKIFKCSVKSNSLVVANTRGFHKRGESSINKERYQIHFRVRIDPFKNLLVQ
tara:strand:- start:54 stop:905 length:852 start_codon:yes stop_codon:yes gene_type:complete